MWSVRARLSAVATSAAAIGLTVAAVAAYVVTYQVLYGQIDESLREVPLSRQETPPGPEADELCSIVSSSRAPSPGLFSVSLITENGEVCASDEEPRIALVAADRDAAGEASVGARIRDGELEDGTPVRIVAVPVENEGAVVVYARDTSSIESVLTTLRWSLVGVILGGVIFSLLLSRWAARASLTPITRFAELAEDIAATGAVDPAPERRASRPRTGTPGAGDELGRLARAFDAMTSALAEAQRQQRRLVADAGHELRTPLASLRANIALLRRSRLLRRSLPDDEEGRLLSDLGAQVVELSALVDDLSELASADAGPRPMEPVRLDLAIEAALERARPRAERHVFDVQLQPWIVVGDEPSLERAAVNLLDNAIKFSPPGSRVEVDLVDGNLTVADQGVGLSTDDEGRVFERFWRSPRARALPGSGLGLSIVADVARLHGGWATLHRRPGGGAIARMHLPGSSAPPWNPAGR